MRICEYKNCLNLFEMGDQKNKKYCSRQCKCNASRKRRNHEKHINECVSNQMEFIKIIKNLS
jgi:hypothetical protein